MFELTNIIPIPLKETTNGLNPDSDVFAARCRFEKGKWYLVKAPSGKGKSTLLHVLYGLRRDYEGEVLFENQNISGFSTETWANHRQVHLSIVFQDLRLFPKLSAMENILVKSSLNGGTTQAQIVEMATSLGIDDILNQSCETLSYGQRQRIAIIRALCQPFEFLLLDEPFSHLDAGNVRLATGLIEKTCRQQQAGVVMVSLGGKYLFQYDKVLEL